MKEIKEKIVIIEADTRFSKGTKVKIMKGFYKGLISHIKDYIKQDEKIYYQLENTEKTNMTDKWIPEENLKETNILGI